MKRRQAIKNFLELGVGAALIGAVAACGRVVSETKELQSAADSADVRDMFIMHYNDEQFGRVIGVLKAEYLKERRNYMFVWQEKKHSHLVVVDNSHYDLLLAGKKAIVESAVDGGHTHIFVIAPDYTDQTAPPIQIDIDDIDRPDAGKPFPMIPEVDHLVDG